MASKVCDCGGEEHMIPSHRKDCPAAGAPDASAPGVYPPEAPSALPGVTAEDFAQLLDHAKNRRVRSFHLRTTMNGVAVDLEGVFEPDPTRKEPRRE